MYKYGKTSTERLVTCDIRIQDIANELIKWLDCTVVCGRRGEKAQEKAFDDGKSKVHWPDSNHNVADKDGKEDFTRLCKAIDIAPYVKGKGIAWDAKSVCLMAGMFLLIAAQKEIKVRWGGDWDSDKDLNDQSFDDLVHFELVD